MKKTLVALAVTAFAASASATTVYDQDGSKVDFYGSLRLLLDNGNAKADGAKTEKHTNLHNDGSRFGVKVKHNIADDFYALGRVEFRFNQKKGDLERTTDEFGDLYAHRAYVGFGSKEFGELTFGRQVLIGDDIAQAGFDNNYGALDSTLATSSKAAIRYDYKGIEGLQIGLDYRFAEQRDADTYEVLTDKLKSGYSVGGIYSFDVAQGQSATVAAGYSRDNYATGTDVKSHKDAYQAGASYTIDDLTLAGDYAGSFKKTGAQKERFNGFSVGAKYQVMPEIALYGNYGRAVKKDKNIPKKDDNGKKFIADVKEVTNTFMLGTEYQIHKNVFTYVEGSISKIKTETKNKETGSFEKTKTTEKNIGVGLRVSW
ncbi:hypothetical protein A6B43_07650 [Vespertiliibacter pulmonis]|uniref:Putative porin n=1 Tax=Vespertiliibacter pulmonis TaxID=1443036 RepID=A0A3N4VX48_9PAST|nr:porin [Vespertiliibacter pulmonis]QLB21402.1 hypothetical protein A6B43_07650 [Vespertiliibacter pulmonis]RPE85815.1 putative porin [Vespertiliibacter pulmonis]